MDYWLECICSALDDVGIIASTEQKKAIAETIKCAHENYGRLYGISLGYEGNETK